MAKLGWFVLAVLVANTILAGWMSWRRYALASELDATTIGTVVSATEGSGRAPTDRLTANYVVNGTTFIVHGASSDDSSLNARQHPVGSKIAVQYNAANPSISALTPRAGYLGLAALTLLLLTLSGVLTYFAVFKRR